MMKAQGWFSLTLECFRYAALELQTLLISLNSSEMHFQLPATCQSSIRLVFNIVTSRGREINTIPCFDGLWMKRIPQRFCAEMTKQQGLEVIFHLPHKFLDLSWQNL